MSVEILPSSRSACAMHRRWAGSAAAPTAVVLLIYTLWLVSILPHSQDGRLFANLGNHFLRLSHASPIINAVPGIDADPTSVGSDGQFVYYIALDPAHARYYIDVPPYRYTRIFYPLLARALSLGRAALIPYALLAINWLAIGGGTLAVAAWLKRRRISPWFALIYGLYPGLTVALRFDLTEALAYALVALAVYLFDTGGTRHRTLSAIPFALSIFTRETSGLFALFYGLSLLPRDARTFGELLAAWRRLAGSALFLAAVCLPFLLYKAFLTHWLGSSGILDSLGPTRTPYEGLLAWNTSNSNQLPEWQSIAIPGLLALLLTGRYLRQHPCGTLQIWLLVAHVLLFTMFLNASSYQHYADAARITTGVILATLYCLPYIDRTNIWNRLCFLGAVDLWLWSMPAWLFLPDLNLVLRWIP